MVLVRFQKDIMRDYSGLEDKDILEIPWLLGGEARIEEDAFIMEFNPDRPDLYSIQGITRAIRAFKGIEKYREPKIVDTGFQVECRSPSQRPYFAAGIINNVNVKKLLVNIIDYQEKLHKTIGRDRKLSAIGLHDLSKVKFPLKYEEVDRDHNFIPLGLNDEMTLREFMKNNEKASEYGYLVGEKIPAITDREGNIISLPPILNSNITVIDDNTKDIFVDVTGTINNIVNKTLILILSSLSYPDGKLSTVLINGKESPEIKRKKIRIPEKQLKDIIGYKIPLEEIKYSLLKMGYGVEQDGIIIPEYRFDILHSVDVVEDIIKGIGYDKVKMKEENFVTYGKPNDLRYLENKIRLLMIGYDMTEVVNNVLTNRSFNKMYGFDDDAIEILNPLSGEQDYIRTRIAPSLMQSLLNNYRNPYPQRIFEIGTIHRKGKEIESLGIAVAHREASFSEIKGIFIGLMEDLDVKQYDTERYSLPMFVNGRLAKILINGKEGGFFGEVNPMILKNIGLKMPVALGEIDISEVLL